MIHKTTRSILSVLLAALLLVTSTPLTPAFAGEEGAVSLQSESGEGGELEQVDGVYQIGSAAELAKFRDKVNSGETDANAVLTADINLNPKMEISEDGTVTNGNELYRWTPIGTDINQYRGTFNGDGHTISGLYIDSSSANDQGLFGYVSGKVQNLSVSGSVSVSGGEDVGGIVGYNSSGTVTNCAFSGSVSGSGGWYVGGVVGLNSYSGNVTNCYNTGTVTGPDSGTGNRVGGVVGYNSFSATVTNCYNTGAVDGGVEVGGVVGSNSFSAATVTNCYNTGSVSGGEDVGGVVGSNSFSATVTNCYNTGTVTGPDSGSDNNVGGVVGSNSFGASVTNCYFLQGTAGKGIGVGGDEDAENAESLTADQFKDQNSFTDWDFGSTDSPGIWETNTTLNRPVLTSNHEDDGSKDHPYEIFTATQLENFRDLVNRGGAGASAHAKLMNNIDLSEICGENIDGQPVSWNPIGNDAHQYIGTFDGNGKTISGLYINNSTADYQGLFGYVGGFVGSEGTVQNLSVSGSVSGGMYVGGVVGLNRGSVEDCDFTGSVSGSEDVGGVVGSNSFSATVTNCYNTGTVSGPDSGTSNYVGGVVGYNSGPVKNCYNTGSVSGPDSGSGNYVGGVVGLNHGSVENCYNTGSVTSSGSPVGGVVGENRNSASVINCYFLKTANVNKDLPGIGKNVGSGDATATAKDDTAFHSGEVAYLLGEAWGQSALGTKDSWPTLVALDKANAQKVYQVTFDYGTSFADNDDRYDYRYANANDNVTLPTSTDPIPSYEGHTLSGWQNEDGQAVTEPITITSDTTYYAQWTKNTVNYTVTVTTSPAEGGTVNGGGTFAEGTQVTVTATANDGYTFVAWQEGGTKIENAGTSYTFTVKGNRSLTAVFEKDEDPTPTPTPDPTPSGPSTGDSSGWDDILDELENTAKGDEITIDMGDETKVPAEIFESLAGKDVDVTFDLGDDLSWTVNGKDIPDDAALADLDLGVALDTDGIPVNVINAITGEVGTVQITLAHNGEFGFTMTLTAPLGKENAGYWANLYHYDEDAEALNFEAAAKIDEDGSVTIPFSHASQYAIVIDTHSHAAVDVSDLFSDVAPDAWYKDAVQYAYDHGLMTGVSDTEFAPEATTTRAMIVSILARLENVTTAEAAGFADVDDNDWYATAVNWAASVGVVNGYEDNTFKPNTAITREQLAAILMNYAVYKGEDVSARADLTNYTDQPSTWAEETMQWAVAEGLISGVTNDQLQPQGNATRAQVAAILQRFLEA